MYLFRLENKKMLILFIYLFVSLFIVSYILNVF